MKSFGDHRMPDQPSPPPNDRFKAEMPRIPGVPTPKARPSGPGARWPMILGLMAVLMAVFVGGKILTKPRRTEAPPHAAPQIELPPPVPDLTPSIPVATEQDPVVATISELKPWRSKQFFLHNRITGENVPAVLLRLPTGSATKAAGYWSFALKAPYGSCQLEYIDSLQKLNIEYGYRQAKHPMVGNPCNHSLYDPLKYAPLPGNVLARGAIVQGSDLRPPLGIELNVRDRNILALRTE
jgi:hypothetical protein